MARIRSADTKPEIALRKSLFAFGFRYRKNVRALPGKPDLVFKKHNAVVFINGCFWHGHKHCSKSKIPASHTEFWINKIRTNIDRDKRNIAALQKEGWRVLIVWTCALSNKTKFSLALSETVAWLKSDETFREISGVSKKE